MPVGEAGRFKSAATTSCVRLIGVALVAVGIAAGYSDNASAAPPPVQLPTDESLQSGATGTGPLDFLTGLPRSSYVLGDIWGLRTLLSSYGITFAIQETSEVLGNVTGGARTGADYDGLTQAILQLDTRRAFGWYGG